MMDSVIRNVFTEAQNTLEKFCNDEENFKLLADAINQLVQTYKSEGKVMSCGNGGSMCDAMHFAEELTGRFRKNRRALPAMAINDPGHISCVANDFGYEHIFSRTVDAFGKAEDTLLAISTSGNSQNVINAVNIAKGKGMKVIGLLGKDGGQLKSLVDFPIIVPADVADRIQEMHIKIIHLFIEGIERNLFPEHY